MIKPFSIIWAHRKMLLSTVKADIKMRYAGSMLGLLWLVLYPALMLIAYSFVYVFILNVRLEQMATPQYVMLIFAGLIPFLGFSEGLSSSTVSVTANASLIKNTLYPIDIIPVKAVLVSQCTEIVGFALLLIATGASGLLTWYTPLILLIWFFQILFGIGIGWIFASLNVVSRDLQNFVGIITMFLMMVSPIAYTPEMIPAHMRSLLKLNPLSYFIAAYQDVLINGRFPTENVLPILIVLSLAIFWLGRWFFQKMKQIFSDNV